MIRRTLLLFCSVFLAFGLRAEIVPNAKVKAKVAAKLDGIQQSIMDVQNGLREFQETGHCRGCENSIRMLENQVADLSWFFLATKPELLQKHILPQLNKLRTWVDNRTRSPLSTKW